MAEAKTTEATAKGEDMQRYELVYLVANKFSEDEVGPIMADIVGLLKKHGAAIVKEENWGKRRLAYPIGQYRHAYYAFVECDMPPAGANEIERTLRLDERLMRHLLVKTRIKTANELEAERRAAKSLHEEGEKKTESESKAQEPTTEPTETNNEKEEDKKSDAGKVGMEQLDEKLNKIVDDAGKLV